MIRSRNSNAPAVPMERATFLAFFLLFILGSKKSIKCFSINTMTCLLYTSSPTTPPTLFLPMILPVLITPFAAWIWQLLLLGPVSYTHLDVYKRQIWDNTIFYIFHIIALFAYTLSFYSSEIVFVKIFFCYPAFSTYFFFYRNCMVFDAIISYTFFRNYCNYQTSS